MKTLLSKEKDILFLTNLLNIFIVLFLAIPYAIFRSEGNFDIGFIFIIWLSTYMNLGSSIDQGNTSNDDILLRSMPIEPGLIVKSKYVSALLMILNSLVIFILVTLLTMNTFYSGQTIFEIFNIGKITVSVSVILFLLSLSLWSYYFKKGVNKKKSSSFDIMITPIPFLVLLGVIWKAREDVDLINMMGKFDNPIFVIFIFVTALLLYFISYLISLRMYRKKEF
ncbi:MAG: hypothetical protein GX787_08995 [Tissierellia bacterium]|nr:hypothetical protein [Tissierellia bacterium]